MSLSNIHAVQQMFFFIFVKIKPSMTLSLNGKGVGGVGGHIQDGQIDNDTKCFPKPTDHFV